MRRLFGPMGYNKMGPIRADRVVMLGIHDEHTTKMLQEMRK